MSKAAAIIPARWGSTRFPGKPLALVAGEPLIRHVWDRCQEARSLDRVIVATDDMRIAEAAFAFGAEVALTSPRHATGTDRLAEVARRLTGFQFIINVQGDEPAIDPGLIDQLTGELGRDAKLAMVTAAAPFTDRACAADPNNVKVVVDRGGDALYFSRSLIPFDRDGGGRLKPLHHIGIYGYRRAFLLKYVDWKPTPLERTEKLEQLRALENGARIRVVTAQRRSAGVDTPADVAIAEAELAALKRRRRRQPRASKPGVF